MLPVHSCPSESHSMASRPGISAAFAYRLSRTTLTSSKSGPRYARNGSDCHWTTPSASSSGRWWWHNWSRSRSAALEVSVSDTASGSGIDLPAGTSMSSLTICRRGSAERTANTRSHRQVASVGLRDGELTMLSLIRPRYSKPCGLMPVDAAHIRKTLIFDCRLFPNPNANAVATEGRSGQRRENEQRRYRTS